MINDERNDLLELYLVLPFGIESTIYPWGITTIKEFIDKSGECINTKTVDFKQDYYFTKIIVKHSALLKKILRLLKRRQVSCFFNLAVNPYNFVGAIACCGRDFLKKMNINARLSAEEWEEIDHIKSELENHILKKIRDSASVDISAFRVWAFSVYDGTLFNALYISSLIKKIDPKSTIIFGGDYFDFDSAEKLIRDSTLIDGVIVGYGEEVLRRICVGINQGLPVNEQEMKGLVNSKYIQNADEGVVCKEVETPPFYYNLNEHPVLTYVKQSESGVLHVLTQRGCSWGRCSFCTQIDRCNLFTISSNELLRQIFDIIQSANLSKVDISFDSEEVSCEFLIALLKNIQKKSNLNVIFHIKIWFQVKSFKKELIEELMKADSTKVNITFGLNFESLSHNTLIHMKKGHTPFKAIESAKAIIDCGQSYNTNYFIEFPLENSSSIVDEINILERVVHLLKHERGDVFLFPYSANKRDNIYNNQEVYNVVIKRNSKDKLLKKVFGVDLPCSYWAYEYKYRFYGSFDYLLKYIYSHINRCHFEEVTLNGIEKQFLTHDDLTNYKYLTDKWHKVELSLWKSALKILSLFKKGEAYQRRLDVYSYLAGDINTTLTEKVCSFQITGDALMKNYNFSNIQEKWTIHLDNVEKKILRFLYWRRKMDDVIRKFEPVRSREEIISFINHHIQLGTIIKVDELLLCVANDPGYWSERE